MARPDETGSGEMLSSSAMGATFLIIIQLASRIFTFASNQLILRALSPIVLGIAAQLELYQVSILYFSRESIRMAIQRQPEITISASPSHAKGSGKRETDLVNIQSLASQSVVNISYLGLVLGLPICLMLTTLYQQLVPQETSQAPFFYPSLIMTGIASLLEISVEPFFAVVQQRMLYEKRAAVEVPAAFLKSLTTCSVFLYAARANYDVGVLPFALGHLSYSLTLICGYSLAFLKTTSEEHFTFLLRRIQSSDSSNYFMGRFSRRLTSLAASVFFQSLVKHLLTQGDSMILAALSGLEDQGIYSLASNYGGLIARILFQPLEESSRNLFSTLLSPYDTGNPRSSHIHTAKKHFVSILRAYQLLSILIIPLGPVMVPQLLHILGGRQWSSAKVGDLLSLYCCYIPFLAFNGITEAFVSSAASPREIRKQTAWMGAFSACYALAAYLFLEIGQLGAYGLVLANMVNMTVRTLWSFIFTRSYLRRQGNGLRLQDIAIQPASYILWIITTVVMLNQGLLKPGLGLIRASVISGAYALLV
ncbi:hypothetical protein NUU61_003690 [Penicillium alfredii]|uniref:Man(5)GlcNAc(2)-PP-dolichol translocation protein RFT1 n=1 Tax=Penicillium alfredii TaxID=1506179 RepID=A0A9W9FJN7_9EURO|nr:uncharacterized protein NUU61_003690 [Penicillium alfredii]KAJ5101468.1 hypothetical protein NUU61_003690 [Penicillium alfredii]